ncbi:MAG: deoxyribose-phosphate aldolase [Methylacidiphilales bacterium]|nr:deoxyribose-phosphate aldolase [Candidatus Methylacidiphilales bacterium]
MKTTTESLASLIDHTLLKPDVTVTQIKKLCHEALEFGFYSVCINPYWISTAKPLLAGSGVKICTVAGFPLGANLPKSKAHEAAIAFAAGADEIDMVMNIGAALENHWNFIEHEIHEVVSVSRQHPVKVVLETCLLNDEQIREACKATENAGAAFVKTSTGFGSGGATVEAVQLMRKSVSAALGVKASGGIRTRDAALKLVEAGANRLGTSSGIAIVQGAV